MTGLVTAQDITYNDAYSKAREFAYVGNYSEAKKILFDTKYDDVESPNADILLARTLSWTGNYDEARGKFNSIIAKYKRNEALWIAAIKNELYADNNATALGLSNKALEYVTNNEDIIRLRSLAQKRIEHQEYPKKSWVDEERLAVKKSNNTSAENIKNSKKSDKTVKAKVEKVEPKNRVSIRNSFRVFDQRYDPTIASTISYKRQTKYGSIIPKINYANRLGKQGVQYDLDLYPKLAKKIYAFVNYGFSNAELYPSHKVSTDVYFSLPGSIEFSAGGRYMVFDNRNIKVISNSLGHYRSNYYFSLRSYITPKSNGLTSVSGGLLVRKYLRDGDNYFGVTAGLGYSPELRQFFSDGNLLSESLLFTESQRLGMEYQFSAKTNPNNVYKANFGVTRQELSFDAGKFFLAFSAGLTYNVNF